MIRDIESGKSEIRNLLEEARQSPKERVCEIVELLEDEAVLSRKFPSREVSKKYKTDRNQYINLCKAYMIYLFNNFVLDDEDTKIMLVAFNYLPAYEHEKRPFNVELYTSKKSMDHGTRKRHVANP